jgi:zinc/manganese transport system permease protein
MSLSALTIGGLFAGLAMAGIATWISRNTALKEDASLAAIYPISLASGMLLLSLSSHRVDLTHLLFGSALAVDSQTLKAMLAVSLVTLIIGGIIFRALFLDTFDPVFLATVSRSGPFAHAMFMVLVVLNLVLGFQAVGALMMVGLMMLPATAAMFWSRRIAFIMMAAAGTAVISVYGGLLLSFHGGLASGPCIVLMAGIFYVASMVFGPVNGLAWR